MQRNSLASISRHQGRQLRRGRRRRHAVQEAASPARLHQGRGNGSGDLRASAASSKVIDSYDVLLQVAAHRKVRGSELLAQARDLGVEQGGLVADGGVQERAEAQEGGGVVVRKLSACSSRCCTSSACCTRASKCCPSGSSAVSRILPLRFWASLCVVCAEHRLHILHGSSALCAEIGFPNAICFCYHGQITATNLVIAGDFADPSDGCCLCFIIFSDFHGLDCSHADMLIVLDNTRREGTSFCANLWLRRTRIR